MRCLPLASARPSWAHRRTPTPPRDPLPAAMLAHDVHVLRFVSDALAPRARGTGFGMTDDRIVAVLDAGSSGVSGLIAAGFIVAVVCGGLGWWIGRRSAGAVAKQVAIEPPAEARPPPVSSTPPVTAEARVETAERRETPPARTARDEALATSVRQLTHDLNNSLTVIGGSLAVVRHAARSGADASDSLGEAERAVMRAKEQVRQISAAARGEAVTSAAPEPIARAPAVVPLSRLHGRVLLMDDEEPIRKLAGRMLSRLGLAVEVASDGAEAVAMFRAAMDEGRPFDAVMVDLTVPGGMGGLEAFGHMRALDPGVRGVVSSGYSNEMILGEYREHGFAGMIAKPYRIDDCARTLGEVLARPRGAA